MAVIDSYSEANRDGSTAIHGGGVEGMSQSFTGNGGTLGSVRLQLNKTGSPTGTAVVKVYAHSGTFGTDSVPTGAALATSDTFDVATLTGDLELITFMFSGDN